MNRPTALSLAGVYRPRPAASGFAIPVFAEAGHHYVQECDNERIIGFVPCDIEKSELVDGVVQLVRRIGDGRVYGFCFPGGQVLVAERASLQHAIRDALPLPELGPFARLDIAEFLESADLLRIARLETEALLSAHTASQMARPQVLQGPRGRMTMAKRIVFCADGTWNGPESQTGVTPIDSADEHGELQSAKVTNVVKVFANLAGQVTPQSLTMRDEQEKALLDAASRTLQIAKYIHGVGDSDSFLKKAMGGMFGMGVIARIVRGYTFISRHYDPGDEIHIAGFSRGAYTARALAGMIASVGLLNRATYDPEDKNEAYGRGVAAWCKCKSMSLHGAGKLTDLANHLLNFVSGFFARGLDADDLIAEVPIKSVAVWDTVGSMGIPAYAADKRFDVFRFVDTRLSNSVQNGFHAMAVDEQRADFPVTAWDSRAGVNQVWFAGAHADVGGGYPTQESGLSDIALEWMLQQLVGVGLRLASPLTYQPNPLIDPHIHKPWTKAPFALLPRAPRQVAHTEMIHESVLRRWQADRSYRPEALAAVSSRFVQVRGTP